MSKEVTTHLKEDKRKNRAREEELWEREFQEWAE